MKIQYLTPENIHHFIDLALQEDVGDGDHSTLASVSENSERKAKLLIKGEGIIAGVEMAQYIFQRVDPTLKIERLLQDGDRVKYGDIGFYVSGKARSILTAERLVLNCMQRMSGIATLTHQVVQKIKHTRAQILDTRKTTPNFRLPEKWAVLIGGGNNHRYGLFDMIMLKDNHIAYAGGIEKAIQATHVYLKTIQKELRIEIETQNLMELEQVLALGGVDVIMLDNMSNEDMKKAVELVGGKYPLEASGGITIDNIREVAETGVDYISMGALTHSAPSMDISLKATED
ncbi:MAG: carboxylating nicotinate-nucleotide diphosphorylase [Microscillaceae bacterium]|nr:carboxylating nicotinate-nucleotide diphosphorylase [Microscillaceae bacterium]